MKGATARIHPQRNRQGGIERLVYMAYDTNTKQPLGPQIVVSDPLNDVDRINAMLELEEAVRPLGYELQSEAVMAGEVPGGEAHN
jgi:hypothetical protein